MLSWSLTPRSSLTTHHKRWLTIGGALTQHLGAYGAINIKVINEYNSKVFMDESHHLRLATNDICWIREVVISVNNLPLVVARSLTAHQDSKNHWRAIRQLGNTPLASLLYQDKRIVRSQFETRQLRHQDPLYKIAAPYRHPSDHFSPLYARRSIFHKSGHGLIVAECFLPHFWTHIHNNTLIPPTDGDVNMPI